MHVLHKTRQCDYWLQLLSSPLTKWNFPVPCKLGRKPGSFPKLERDFPDFWIEFYAGFYEWVNDRLMTNSYKQYFASSGVYFGLLFQIIKVRITAKWIGIKVSL